MSSLAEELLDSAQMPTMTSAMARRMAETFGAPDEDAFLPGESLSGESAEPAPVVAAVSSVPETVASGIRRTGGGAVRQPP